MLHNVDKAVWDHPSWSATDERDDDFDASAMEEAIRRSRREAYAALADLDAA